MRTSASIIYHHVSEVKADRPYDNPKMVRITLVDEYGEDSIERICIVFETLDAAQKFVSSLAVKEAVNA